MAFKPAPITPLLTVEERLAAGIQMVEAMKVAFYPEPHRAIRKLKLNIATEVAEDRYLYGLTPEETQLLWTLLHA